MNHLPILKHLNAEFTKQVTISNATEHQRSCNAHNPEAHMFKPCTIAQNILIPNGKAPLGRNFLQTQTLVLAGESVPDKQKAWIRKIIKNLHNIARIYFQEN